MPEDCDEVEEERQEDVLPRQEQQPITSLLLTCSELGGQLLLFALQGKAWCEMQPQSGRTFCRNGVRCHHRCHSTMRPKLHTLRRTAPGAYAPPLFDRENRHMLRHMPINLPIPEGDVTERHASLFRNGRNQAARIPREFEMEGTEVLMRKEGDRLILTPIRKNRLLELLASWEPLEEGLPDVEDLPPQQRADF